MASLNGDCFKRKRDCYRRNDYVFSLLMYNYRSMIQNVPMIDSSAFLMEKININIEFKENNSKNLLKKTKNNNFLYFC